MNSTRTVAPTMQQANGPREFQYTNGETSHSEPVIQNVWSQKTAAKTSESGEGEARFTYAYDRPSMIAVQQQSNATRIPSDVNQLSYIHIAPKLDSRRLSFSGSISENASSSPSNSPEGAGMSSNMVYDENHSPLKVGSCIY